MSGMQVQNLNGVNVYNLASGKTLPQWMKDKGRKALSKDDDYRRRVELLQDFNFGTASQCIEISPDGNFVAVTGTYPPSFKVYELSQVSMKFERRCDEEVCAMKILSDDWTKIALLLADRTVAFHASYGIHHTMRIPQPGRSMVYDSTNCDLVVGGSSQDVYRLNLDKGCMMEPYRVQSESVNAVALNPAHPLLGCAGDDGVVECFDSRASNKICVGRYDVGAMMARRGMDGLGINQHHISCSSLTLRFLRNSGVRTSVDAPLTRLEPRDRCEGAPAGSLPGVGDESALVCEESVELIRIHDPVAVALLGEEQLAVGGEVLIARVARDHGVERRLLAALLGAEDPTEALGLFLTAAIGP